MDRWFAKAVQALVVVAALFMTACSGRSNTHAYHGHYHDYRHGYYNPVDGYFHDDHWHHGYRRSGGRGCSTAATYHYY